MNSRLVSQQTPLSPQKVRHWCTNNYVHFILHPTHEDFLRELPELLSVFACTPNLPQLHQHVLSGDSLETCYILVSNHWYQFNTSATFSSLKTSGGKTGPTHWAGLFSPLLLAGWVEVLNSSPLLGPPRLTPWKNRAGRLANLSTYFFFCSMGQTKFTVEWHNIFYHNLSHKFVFTTSFFAANIFF